MGNSNKKNSIMDKKNEKAEEILKEKDSLEKNILIEELNNRENNDIKGKKKKSKKSNILNNKSKFDLNIYIYSNSNENKRIENALIQYNTEVFNWNIKKLIGFSKENSDKLFKICDQDFKDKKFKDVIIIPIKSISDFKNQIELDGKDIFLPFAELTEEQQPFFLIIDEEKNDFNEYKEVIKLQYSEKEDNGMDYTHFSEEISKKILEHKRKDNDFQIKIDFIIYEVNNINKLKEYMLKKKNKNDDFEVYVNDKLFYRNLYGIESFDIINTNDIEEKLSAEIQSNNILNISMILFNVNLSRHYDYCQIFEISEVEFLYYKFKNEELNHILKKEDYEDIDRRNFNVIRSEQSPKNHLLRYTGYFNQLGDILFCDQISFYPAKINIAIGGYIGSGKSTLINTIFGEKRCLEGQGSSITNYISQFSLKDYPINFYDFPGFRASKDGKANTSLFVEEIKSKIANLKKVNEIIHCFLFCIKFQERIFDEKDSEMKEVFDAIAKLKIRTFFIITGSEREDSRQFKNFKKIIINNLTKVKKEYEEADKIFGEDLEQDIIPILSRDKKFHGFTAKAFGLDNLFKVLYDYFLPKKIDFQKEIFFDEKQLKIFIENNELLKVFESKNKLSQDLRDKIKSQFDKFFMKLFLKAPKYAYSFSEDSAYGLINEFMDHLLYLFDYYLNQKNNVEKLHVVNRLHEIKNKINNELFKEGFKDDNEIKQMTEDVKTSIPLAVKIIFPILSPLYYLIGAPVFKLFTGKIIDSLLEELDVDDIIYQAYFEELVANLNIAIDDLDKIRIHFEDVYALNKFGDILKKIIEDNNDEINSNDLNELQKIFCSLLKKYEDPLEKFKGLFNEMKNSFSFNNNETIQKKNTKKINSIFMSLDEQVTKHIMKIAEEKENLEKDVTTSDLID